MRPMIQYLMAMQRRRDTVHALMPVNPRSNGRQRSLYLIYIDVSVWKLYAGAGFMPTTRAWTFRLTADMF